MEKLKQMKECLVGMVEGQIYGNIDKVDAQELGAAVDMIKDLSEALYYCTITEAMEEDDEGKEEKGKHGMMYSSRRMPMYHMPYPIEMYDPRYRERYNSDSMYAQNGGNGGSGSSNGGSMGSTSRGYHEGMIPMYNDGANYSMYARDNREYMNATMRDPREGRSGERRKMYMDGKGMKDKSHQMKELEGYMQELSNDLAEMIQDASPEEKQLLQQKISTLATKIK
jgi:hypothetical protein